MATWTTPKDWAYKEAPGSDKLNEQVRDNLKYLKESLPAGVMMPYAGDTAPTQWLLCDGSAVSRTTYADLFAIIGTTYGSGDGSTTFNLPNAKGKTLVGLDSSDSDFGNLADSPGEKTHKLTIAEMPSHTHIQNSHNHTQNAHNHNIYSDTNYKFQGAKSGGSQINPWAQSGSDYTKSPEISAVQNATATNNATTATNQNTGGDGSHNNIQPSLVINYIIKY